MKEIRAISLEAVHTHTHTHTIYLVNKENKIKINKDSNSLKIF